MWTGGYVSAGTASDGNGSLTIRQPPDSWWISWLTVLIPLAGDHKLGGWRLETRWLANIKQPPGQCEPATWREWNSQRAKVNPVVESKLAEDIYGIPVLHVLKHWSLKSYVINRGLSRISKAKAVMVCEVVFKKLPSHSGSLKGNLHLVDHKRERWQERSRDLKETSLFIG